MPKLQRFQLSVRTLVFVTLCASSCSWFAVKLQQARRQREVVAEIEKIGGQVAYDWQVDANLDLLPDPQPPAPEWLRGLLGDDFFQSVSAFTFITGEATDADIVHLMALRQLKVLDLSATQVTDAGVEHLKEFSQLQRLSLDNTKVTSAGLGHLKGLSRLTYLDLDYTQVTDAGVEHLKGLSQLQELYLVGTQITDAGEKKLQQALPNCKILRD